MPQTAINTCIAPLELQCNKIRLCLMSGNRRSSRTLHGRFRVNQASTSQGSRTQGSNRDVLQSRVIALVGLIIIEIGLLEGFLPYKWQHAIHQQSERIFPNAKYDPHPDMGWEFELDYQQHPPHRVVMYGFLGALVVGVACLISKVWRGLRQVS
jgi:hypothetical protein